MPTKRELIELGPEAIANDVDMAMPVVPSPVLGKVSMVDYEHVMTIGKIMATGQGGVPAHCRGSVGMCLRICFNAVEWGMSPFSLADQTYVVNDRLAYMAAVIHGLVEARAPLQRTPLDTEYIGEGLDRQIKVTGYFISGEKREYLSPKVKDIKVKNSPLWTSDVDQQLHYYGTRAWARRWCPNILLGVYTREELMANMNAGREDAPNEVQSTLRARLAASKTKAKEGHNHEQAVAELNAVAGDDVQTIDGEVVSEPATHDPADGGKLGAIEETTKPKTTRKKKVITDPKTSSEYVQYATAWIKDAELASDLVERWNGERKMRNALGVTEDDRAPLDELRKLRMKEL